MLSEDLVAPLAAELQQAEPSGVQVEHCSERFPGMAMAARYKESQAWVERRLMPLKRRHLATKPPSEQLR